MPDQLIIFGTLSAFVAVLTFSGAVRETWIIYKIRHK
jgi:hypothetical protein